MPTVDATFRIRANGPQSTSWIPQPGQIKSIATNGIYQARNTNIVLNSITQIYSQARSFYNPFFGQYGARCMWGGGHGGYMGNEMYVMPFGSETSAWFRQTDPYPITPEFNVDGVSWRDPTKVDMTTGEFLVNGVAGQYFGFSIPSTHTRNATIAMPGGTNGMGRMLVPLHQAYPGGGFGWSTTHIYDFGKEPTPTYNPAVQYWSRAGALNDVLTNPATITSGDAAWRQPSQQRVGFIYWNTAGRVLGLLRVLYFYYNGNGNNPAPHWELGGTIAGFTDTEAGFGAAVGGDNGMGYCEPRNMLLLQAYSNNFNLGIYFHMVDLARPSPHPAVKMNVVGPRPPLYSASGLQNGASVEYNPIDGYWYGLFCATSRPRNDLWRLRPQDPGISWKDPNITNAQLMAAPHVWEEITDRMPPIVGYWDALRGSPAVALIFGYNRMQFSESMGCFTWDGGAGDAASNNLGQTLLINPIGV